MWQRLGVFWAIVYSAAVPLETLQLLGERSVAVVPAAALAVCWVFAALEVRGRMAVPSAGVWLFAFFVWALFTWFWSVEPNASFGWVQTMALTLVVTLAVSTLLSTRTRQRMAMTGYTLSAAVVAINTVRAPSHGEVVADFDARAVAFGQDPNFLAVSMVIAIPFSLNLATSTPRRWWRLALVAIVPLLAVGAFSTGSRTGVVALALVALVQIVVARRFLSPGRIVAVIVSGAAVWYAAPRLISPEVLSRLLGTSSAIEAGDLNSRQEIWAGAVRLIEDRALAGHGVGTFSAAFKEEFGAAFASHNVFIGAWVETGIVGLFLLLCVLWAAFRPALANGPKSLWLSVLGVWLCGAMTLTLTAEKLTWWLIALAASADLLRRRVEPADEVRVPRQIEPSDEKDVAVGARPSRVG